MQDLCHICDLYIAKGDSVTINGKPTHIGCLSEWVKAKEKELEATSPK